MRVAVLLAACFVVSVLCEVEEKKDQALSEINSDEVLARNLREAHPPKQKGKKKGKDGGEKKKRKNNKGRKKIKDKQNQNGRKTKNGAKGRNGGRKEARKNKQIKNGKKRKNRGKGKSGGKKKNGGKGNSARKGIKKKESGRQTATCNGTALGSTCLTNVIGAMKYERDNVANFINQKARAEEFKKLIGNKGGKNDSFGNSTTYLLTALGGNVSNLTCGTSNSSGTGAVTTYNTLTNCSMAVGMACMVPNTTVNFTQLDECKTYYENVQKTNAGCFDLTMKNSANGTAVCECWESAAAAVATAKQKSSSCTSNKAQKDMKDIKNVCLAAYGVCKKAEDASVSFILKCSGGGTSSSNSSDSTSASTTVSVSSSSNSTNSTSGGRAARLRLN